MKLGNWTGSTGMSLQPPTSKTVTRVSQLYGDVSNDSEVTLVKY